MEGFLISPLVKDGTTDPLSVVCDNAKALPSLAPITNLPHDHSAQLTLLRSSVIIGIIMLLKAHLKSLYGLSEEYVFLTQAPDFSNHIVVDDVQNSLLGKGAH